MKRNISLILCVLLFGLGSQAQQRVIRINTQNQGTHVVPVSGTNRMFFQEDLSVFEHNGELWTTPTIFIDSMTFGYVGSPDTVAVDFHSGIAITWQDSTATIVNALASSGVSITANGAHVSIDASADSADITYILRGSSSDGSLTINTDKKLVLCLDNLQLTNPGGPAILIDKKKRAALHLLGANSLSDGSGNSGKAALQNKGELVLQGSGSLTVTSMAKHGIQSGETTTLASGSVTVAGAGKDGLNVNGFVMHGGSLTVRNTRSDGVDGDEGGVLIDGGVLDVACDADDVKGLSCDDSLSIAGGTVNISVSGVQSKAIKTKSDMAIIDGLITLHANGTVALEEDSLGFEPSYCTGIKVGGDLRISGGTTRVTCPDSNAGSKAVSADGSIYIAKGVVELASMGSCAPYTNAAGINDSYNGTALKADGDIVVAGGIVTANASGRAISCDGSYSQSGGEVSTSTSGNGFTLVGSRTSCTDGFAPACLKADGDIDFSGGTFNASSTGVGGRGIVADGSLTVGRMGDSDSLLTLYVTTSGAPVNAYSGGGHWDDVDYWKGLPKGFKIEDSIHIYSGHIMSYCSQTSGDPTGEAIETKGYMTIDGGTIEANAYDDAINAGTGLTINGGRIWAYSRGNDGIDCNGTYTYINGGVVIATGREVGIDANTDRGGHFLLNGGTVFSQGGTMGAWDSPSSSSSQRYLMLGGNSGGPGGGSGSTVSVTDGFCVRSGETDIMVFKSNAVTGSGFETGTKPPPPPGGGNGSIAISTPAIASGTSYTLYTTVTISGGTQWHGLYDGASCAVSGNGTAVSPR